MNDQSNDNPLYLAKKRHYDNMITLFGRKPVLEILESKDIEIHRLHLATTNRPAAIIGEIENLAESRQIDIRYHDRKQLSRISKNGRQDQGAAVDIVAPNYHSLDDLEEPKGRFELLLLDRISNPQNLGMIIRSVAASPISGLVLPKTGCARIDALVVKASAGALFKATIYHAKDTISAIRALKLKGLVICGLDAQGDTLLSSLGDEQARVLVLGNETMGLSSEISLCCDHLVSIPMANQVESLNVAAAAAIIAFRSLV